jgi:hypothetical protein
MTTFEIEEYDMPIPLRRRVVDVTEHAEEDEHSTPTTEVTAAIPTQAAALDLLIAAAEATVVEARIPAQTLKRLLGAIHMAEMALAGGEPR